MDSGSRQASQPGKPQARPFPRQARFFGGRRRSVRRMPGIRSLTMHTPRSPCLPCPCPSRHLPPYPYEHHKKKTDPSHPDQGPPPFVRSFARRRRWAAAAYPTAGGVRERAKGVRIRNGEARPHAQNLLLLLLLLLLLHTPAKANRIAILSCPRGPAACNAHVFSPNPFAWGGRKFPFSLAPSSPRGSWTPLSHVRIVGRIWNSSVGLGFLHSHRQWFRPRYRG